MLSHASNRGRRTARAQPNDRGRRTKTTKAMSWKMEGSVAAAAVAAVMAVAVGGSPMEPVALAASTLLCFFSIDCCGIVGFWCFRSS